MLRWIESKHQLRFARQQATIRRLLEHLLLKVRTSRARKSTERRQHLSVVLLSQTLGAILIKLVHRTITPRSSTIFTHRLLTMEEACLRQEMFVAILESKSSNSRTLRSKTMHSTTWSGLIRISIQANLEVVALTRKDRVDHSTLAKETPIWVLTEEQTRSTLSWSRSRKSLLGSMAHPEYKQRTKRYKIKDRSKQTAQEAAKTCLASTMVTKASILRCSQPTVASTVNTSSTSSNSWQLKLYSCSIIWRTTMLLAIRAVRPLKQWYAGLRPWTRTTTQLSGSNQWIPPIIVAYKAAKIGLMRTRYRLKLIWTKFWDRPSMATKVMSQCHFKWTTKGRWVASPNSQVS